MVLILNRMVYKRFDKDLFEKLWTVDLIDESQDQVKAWFDKLILCGFATFDTQPFSTVCMNGWTLDEKGEKMSKSKGNIIDPIEMVDKYGADALRTALIWGALVENDNSLSEENVKGQRNFANKIWNVARFVLQNDILPSTISHQPLAINPDDKWIKAELKTTTKKVTRALDKYRLNEAAEEIYDFVWHKFADVYIERFKNSKTPNFQVLYVVLDGILKLLHPFMPFVTEKIWGLMDHKELLISAGWPKA